jgi:hypothetical protein
MTVDFLKMADFLQEERQEFYQVLRRGGDERKRQVAIERLRRVINQVEPVARDPGEAWKSLAMEQRWGYMRGLSHLGTAMHELKSVGGSSILSRRRVTAYPSAPWLPAELLS